MVSRKGRNRERECRSASYRTKRTEVRKLTNIQEGYSLLKSCLGAMKGGAREEKDCRVKKEPPATPAEEDKILLQGKKKESKRNPS